MNKDEEEEFKVILSPDVEESMAKDPDLAKAMKEFSALARQAMQSVESGQYKTFEEAMAAFGYKYSDLIFDDEEE